MTSATLRFSLLRSLFFLALLAAVLAVLAPGPSPAESAFPGVNGKIAFMSTRDGNTEIYVMNADGSGQTKPDWQPLVVVGGIAEVVVDGREPSAGSADGSGASAPPYAAIAAVTAGALALAAGGWYARRRWLR